MANTKISALTNGNPAQSGDVIPIDRAGANFSVTASSVAALALAGTPALPNGTTATTQTTGDNTTKLATDAFVTASIAAGAQSYQEFTGSGNTIVVAGTGATKVYINYSPAAGDSTTLPDGNVLGQTCQIACNGSARSLSFTWSIAVANGDSFANVLLGGNNVTNGSQAYGATLMWTGTSYGWTLVSQNSGTTN